MPPLSRRRQVDRSSSSSPGGMNARSFMSGTRWRRASRPPANAAAPAARLQRHWICASSSMRSGKHRTAREVIGEERRLLRHAQQRAHALAATSSTMSRSCSGTPVNCPPGAPGPHSSSKRSRIASGLSKLFHRQHRPDAVLELDDRYAIDVRPRAVVDGFLVVVVDLGRADPASGRGAPPVRTAGPQPPRPPGAERKSSAAMRDPGRELTGGFDREAGRKARTRGQEPEAALPALSGLQAGDAIDEGEGPEMSGRRAGGASWLTRRWRRPAARVPPACRTSPR